MTKGQKVMALACGLEAATGLGLLVAPSMVAMLVLGSEVADVAITICNIAGIALIALAIACWPRTGATSRAPYAGMFVYNLLVALLLGETAVAGTVGGLLLWPVVVTHFALAALIPLGSFGRRRVSADQS
jgi:hypothetical protein